MRKRIPSSDRALMLAAFAVLACAFALDLLTPQNLEWAQIYLVAVAIMAWAAGRSSGLVFAAIVALLALSVDVGAFRPVLQRPETMAAVWNAASEFLVYALVAEVTVRARRAGARQQVENRDQARLLQLLEHEFLRPLRAVYWFALKFEDTFGPEPALNDRMASQLASLRHHVRELNFLATDLLRIGRLPTDGLLFAQEAVDLKRTAAEAANEVLDRKSVVFAASTDEVIVRADPASLHHAIASVIGRLLEGAPVHEVVQVFVRSSGGEGVVEFSCRREDFAAVSFELADLLTQANRGRLTIIPRGADLGVRVNLHIPRMTASLATPPASPSVA
ncbi:MAG TPA: hypothetical protein VIN70_08100 [Candidatus Limnocylindria bacterium]